MFWAIFSNLPQPILAVPAYLFVETFRHLLPLGTGAAAGAMIFMVRRISTAGKKSRRLTLRCVRLLAGVCGVDSGRAGVDVGVGGGAYRDGLCGEYGGAAAGLREPDVTLPKKCKCESLRAALACQLLLSENCCGTEFLY